MLRQRQHQWTRVLLLPALVIASIFAMAASLNLAAHAEMATADPTGVMVPLYTYPGQTWDTVIQAKNANPAVPVVAIINPSNGPGSYDPNYASGITSLKQAGIIVLGYVFTGYGSRDAGSIESDINSYKNWYGVNGIFFDEMSNVAGQEGYYKNLSEYAKSQGLAMTVGNPGADTAASYIGTMDNIIIYENWGLPTSTYLAGWHTSYSKDNFAIIPYGVSSLDSSYVAAAAAYVKYIYITDDSLPNPWDSVPSYFGALVSAVNAADGNMNVNTNTNPNPNSTSTPAPVTQQAPEQSGTSSITVNSVDQNSAAINGYYTVLSQNGGVLQTGFTPVTFQPSAGQQYTIEVQDYGNYHFDHWADNGSTNRDRSVTAGSGGTTLTAVYASSGSGSNPGPSPITNPPAAQSTISVTTTDYSGNPITGYYTTLWQNGQQIQSGFSPQTFTVSNGQTYQVAVSDYGNFVFDHWSDGTTNRFHTVTTGSGTTTNLVAIYRTG